MYYFPSCNFTIADRETAKSVRDYMSQFMAVKGCCLYDKQEYNHETGYVVCQACREHLESKLEIKTIYEWILQDSNFQFPDYHQQRMSIVDCWRDRNHPEVHQACRDLMKKMNIQLVEIEESREKSEYCGTLHFKSKLRDLEGIKISDLPMEEQIELMKEQVAKYEKDILIVCDCNRCLKGIELGEGNGIHLLKLLFPNQSKG